MRAAIVLCLVAFFVAVKADQNDDWWKTMLLYEIYPRSFKDGDGDGMGDLKGVISKLDHLLDANVNAFWLSPFYQSPMVDFGYDISDYLAIDRMFGVDKDFDDLVKAAHENNLKILIDFIPNHTSEDHAWFKLSVNNVPPYNEYYVWHPGRLLENGTRVPPNNWVSMFAGTMWTWREERQAYYLHQFTKAQPDLNYSNPLVLQEIKGVMRYWLNKGIDGFRVDAAYFIAEDERYLDEPLSGDTDNPNNYSYTLKYYTQDMPDTFRVLHEFRNLLDEYKPTKIMIVETYTNSSMTRKYHQNGANIAFNFRMLTDLGKWSKAVDFKNMVDDWMANVAGNEYPANWVIGSHDVKRVTERYGPRTKAVTVMSLLLPGVGVTYNGDEIGMEDRWISWEDSMDPFGCQLDKEHYEIKTRDPARTPFQWDNTTSAGFSTNNHTWLPIHQNYKTLNLATEKEQKDSFYNFYKSLTQLRKTDVFKTGKLVTKMLNDNVFAFSRETAEHGSIYAIINFEPQEETVNLSAFPEKPSTLKLYYASGNHSIPAVISTNTDLKIPASGVAVFVTENLQ